MIVQKSSYAYLPLFLIYTVPFGKVCTNSTLYFSLLSFIFARNNEDSAYVVIDLSSSGVYGSLFCCCNCSISVTQKANGKMKINIFVNEKFL